MKYLVLLFVAFASVAYGEPFYPALRPAKVDSLRRQLRQSRPDTSRVKLLLALSHDLISRAYYADSLGSQSMSDTASAYIKQAQTISENLKFIAGQIDSNYALAFFFFGAYRQRVAKKVVWSGLAYSQQQHDRYREAIGWYLMSQAYGNSPAETTQRLRCFERAARLARAIHNPLLEARCLKEMADMHLRQGNAQLAQQGLLQALALYRRGGYNNIHYTYDLLSATDEVIGDYEKALHHALAAIQSAKSSRDTVLLCAFYMRAAGVLQQLNQPEKAIDYFQLALRSAEDNHYGDDVVLDYAVGITRNLLAIKKPRQALALLLQKRQAHPTRDTYARLLVAEALTHCYLALRQYTQASVACAQVVALLKTDVIEGNHRLETRMYKTIGSYYLATHNYSNARVNLNKALATGKLEGTPSAMAATCLLLFRTDSAQGYLPAAILHYKRYKALTDSIFTEKNGKQMAVLRVQNETNKREQRIALLTKQTQVQQANIARQQTQRNAVLASTGLLALLLAVSYNRYRIKQRSNQLLEAQQREIDHKNQSLEQVLSEKETLLAEKEGLIVEKEGLLVEKEWMLKEIHHRVKNNLQIVNELLASQTDNLRDAHTLAIVRESQNRIQAMALIHQKLYQAQNIARVNMAEYIQEIVEHLVASFDCEDWVHTCLEVSGIELDVAVATPMGLIINEVVTNSLKYAFPGRRAGTITISLTEMAASHYRLLLADDGMGLPADLNIASSRTLGMTMLRGLSEQLNASLSFEPGPGVRICLAFEAVRKVVPPAWAA